ncbi:MAG: hypothetical protein ABL895_17050 [Cyclobacteriaceae bacterium]
MKASFIIVAFICLLNSGCDFYREDVPIIVDNTVMYVSNQPILVNLGTYIESENSQAFTIKNNPSGGGAEILANSFLKYSPTHNVEDKIIVDVFDAANAKIAEIRVKLTVSEKTCGIAKFDYGIVKSGSDLTINLTDNDQYCDPIHEAILMYTPIENAEGLSVSIPLKTNPFDPNEETRIELTYHAPVGFTGVARGIYVAGINLKESYKDQWGTDELLINPSEKFQYFVASLVEIKVEE